MSYIVESGQFGGLRIWNKNLKKWLLWGTGMIWRKFSICSRKNNPIQPCTLYNTCIFPLYFFEEFFDWVLTIWERHCALVDVKLVLISTIKISFYYLTCMLEKPSNLPPPPMYNKYFWRLPSVIGLVTFGRIGFLNLLRLSWDRTGPWGLCLGLDNL